MPTFSTHLQKLKTQWAGSLKQSWALSDLRLSARTRPIWIRGSVREHQGRTKFTAPDQQSQSPHFIRALVRTAAASQDCSPSHCGGFLWEHWREEAMHLAALWAWENYKRLNKDWEGGRNRQHKFLSSFDDFGLSALTAYSGISPLILLLLLLPFSFCHLAFSLFFVSRPLTRLPYNGMCFDWCSGGKQGIVWTGSRLRSADRLYGGLGQYSGSQRHLCFSWTLQTLS